MVIITNLCGGIDMNIIGKIMIVLGFIALMVMIWIHPVSEVKTAEVVKTDRSGVEYVYQEFEKYNCFDYCVGTISVENWEF